jgi:ABC-type nitrate/sulfonate/bicarbonate transport system substrate-binding protein
VRKFAAAINQAAAWATRDPVAAAAMLQKFLTVNYTRALDYQARMFDPAFIPPNLDGALRYNILMIPVTADELVFAG